MVWEKIKGYSKDSFIDWPERITPVIFFGGCNLRCPTCHNKDIAYGSQQTKVVPKKLIKADLREKQNWYDGIVLSGGEVTLIPGIVDWIFELRREFHLPIKIDTNGFRVDVVKTLIQFELVDLVAVDIKAPWHLYPKATNTSFLQSQVESIFKEIFQLAKDNPGKFYFRTTKVPLLTDKDIDIIKNYLPTSYKLHIQDYLQK